MKVKELKALLANVDDDADILIADNGSILPTDNADETADYNHDGAPGEFYIVTCEF